MLIVDECNNCTAKEHKNNYKKYKYISVDLLISVEIWKYRWNANNYDQYENQDEGK